MRCVWIAIWHWLEHIRIRYTETKNVARIDRLQEYKSKVQKYISIYSFSALLPNQFDPIVPLATSFFFFSYRVHSNWQFYVYWELIKCIALNLSYGNEKRQQQRNKTQEKIQSARSGFVRRVYLRLINMLQKHQQLNNRHRTSDELYFWNCEY